MVDDKAKDARLKGRMDEVRKSLEAELQSHQLQTLRCEFGSPFLEDQILVFRQHEASLSTAIASKQAALAQLPMDSQ